MFVWIKSWIRICPQTLLNKTATAVMLSTCLPFLYVVPQMFEFMKAQFTCAVALKRTLLRTPDTGGQGRLMATLLGRCTCSGCVLRVWATRWRVRKGYVHDCHHAPARLDAETVCLQLSIWNMKTLSVWQNRGDRSCVGSSASINKVAEGCSGDAKVVSSTTYQSVHEHFLLLIQQWTASLVCMGVIVSVTFLYLRTGSDQGILNLCRYWKVTTDVINRLSRENAKKPPLTNMRSMKSSLRLEMILLRMFISSAGLTSMSYTTRIQMWQHEGRGNTETCTTAEKCWLMVEQHSRPQRAAGRLCGTASPPRSHSVLQTQQACAVEAS